MSVPKQKRNHLARAFGNFWKLFWLYNDFQWILLIGITWQVYVLNTFNTVAWIVVALFDFVIALLAIHTTVRPVETAFESCGLSFSPNYGTPKWILHTKYPCAADTLEFTACGHPAKAYQECVARISAGLNLPIKEITEHHPGAQVLQAHIVRTQIPRFVDFSAIDLDRLSSGHFMYGETDNGFKSETLDEMIHLLVAGQTGGGKTVFIQQVTLTTLARTREAHALVIDMKGGVDFHEFHDLPNCELALTMNEAHVALDRLFEIHKQRSEYLKSKGKRRWSDLSLKDLSSDKSLEKVPIGPILLVADELAELTGSRTHSEQKQSVHQRLSQFARLARATGIHLILGTQRPDRTVIDGQIKDCMVTKMCFSVPSAVASTLVVGNMSAYTIGGLRGRAVVSKGIDRFFVQTPFLSSSKAQELATAISTRLKQQNYVRSILDSVEPKPATDYSGVMK
jgi:FtsK/SpoIIIE family